MAKASLKWMSRRADAYAVGRAIIDAEKGPTVAYNFLRLSRREKDYVDSRNLERDFSGHYDSALQASSMHFEVEGFRAQPGHSNDALKTFITQSLPFFSHDQAATGLISRVGIHFCHYAAGIDRSVINFEWRAHLSKEEDDQLHIDEDLDYVAIANPSNHQPAEHASPSIYDHLEAILPLNMNTTTQIRQNLRSAPTRTLTAWRGGQEKQRRPSPHRTKPATQGTRTICLAWSTKHNTTPALTK